MGILNLLFTIFLLICLPLGQLFPIELGNGIRVSFLDGGLAVFLILWIIQTWRNRKRLSSLIRPLSIFTGIAVVSLLLQIPSLKTSELLISFLYLARWIMYGIIIIPVMNFDKRFKTAIPYLLFLSSVITVFVGYFQYFFFPSLRGLTYEGWDPHLYRMFSTFLDPNFFGSFLVLAFLMGIGIFFTVKKRDAKVFLGTAILLTLFGIFLTFSRSAYIALLVGLSLLVYLKGYKKWLFIVLGTVILLGGLSLALLHRQSEGTNLLRTASTAARIGNMQRAISIIADNPILGVGFNAYRYAQHRKGFIGGQGWETSHSGGGVNNSYLFVWATTGIFGLAAFFYLLVSFFRTAKRSKSTMSIVLLASLGAILVNSLFENTFFYPAVILWIFVLTGVIERD